MIHEALLSEMLILGARAAVVGIGINADATTRGEEPDDLNILGIHQTDEILHDDIDAILMEITMIAKTEEIQLQTLRLHHPLTRNIQDLNLSKVRLPRDGTKRCKLRTVELNPIIVLRMLVLESLQNLRRIVHLILGLPPQRLQPLTLSFCIHL